MPWKRSPLLMFLVSCHRASFTLCDTSTNTPRTPIVYKDNARIEKKNQMSIFSCRTISSMELNTSENGRVGNHATAPMKSLIQGGKSMQNRYHKEINQTAFFWLNASTARIQNLCKIGNYRSTNNLLPSTYFSFIFTMSIQFFFVSHSQNSSWPCKRMQT